MLRWHTPRPKTIRGSVVIKVCSITWWYIHQKQQQYDQKRQRNLAKSTTSPVKSFFFVQPTKSTAKRPPVNSWRSNLFTNALKVLDPNEYWCSSWQFEHTNDHHQQFSAITVDHDITDITFPNPSRRLCAHNARYHQSPNLWVVKGSKKIFKKKIVELSTTWKNPLWYLATRNTALNPLLILIFPSGIPKID